MQRELPNQQNEGSSWKQSEFVFGMQQLKSHKADAQQQQKPHILDTNRYKSGKIMR